MKRKKKKILCNRPRIDLPESHPFRVKLEKNIADTSVWLETDIPGVVFKMVLDHRESIELLTSIDASLLQRVNLTNTTWLQSNYTSPKRGRAISLVARFDTPDADDPERLESGWSLSIFEGPIGATKAMEQRAKAFMEHLHAASQTDRYIEA